MCLVKLLSDLIYSVSEHYSSFIYRVEVFLSFFEVFIIMNIDQFFYAILQRLVDCYIQNLNVVSATCWNKEESDIEISKDLFNLKEKKLE